MKKSDESDIASSINKMLVLQQTALLAPPPMLVASTATVGSVTPETGRIGNVIIHTSRLDVKIAHSSSFTEDEDKKVPRSLSLKDLIKKVKKWKGDDKEKKERIFEVKYNDGRTFLSYTKDELADFALGTVLDMMKFPLSGEVMHINAGFRDVVLSDEEDGDNDDISL